jgi:origin recognition complex subunit 3
MRRIRSPCYPCFGWMRSQFYQELVFWRGWLPRYVRSIRVLIIQQKQSIPQTFFDLDYEPDVMIGPAALDFLTDFFCRNSASVEGVLSILQLAHLKHFDEPLTIFVQDELLGTSSTGLTTEKLSDPNAAAFLTSLFSWSFGPQELASHGAGWPVNDVAGLLASVAEARTSFLSHLCRQRLAFGMMRKVQQVMLKLGYRGAETDKTPLEMMSACLRGGLTREGKNLGTMTKSVGHSFPCTRFCVFSHSVRAQEAA